MAIRVLVGAALSALALMAWGFVFWVVLSAPGGVLRALPDEVGFMATLRSELPVSGTYFFPLPPEDSGGTADGAAIEAFRRRHIAGPVGMIHISREGSDPLSPRIYVMGFLHGFASSLLAALLLLAALPALEGYARRALFVFGLGLFAAVAVRLADPVWWHLPWEHFVQGALYTTVGWLLAGLVLAGTIKPARGAKHYTDPSQPLWKRALDMD